MKAKSMAEACWLTIRKDLMDRGFFVIKGKNLNDLVEAEKEQITVIEETLEMYKNGKGN